MTDTETTATTTEIDPSQAVLGAEGLTRRFGGLIAVDHVDLAVRENELRSVIGPNGAGKTTLFNVLTNALAPSEGDVYYQGTNITDVPQYERPHLGLVRSFQSNQLFESKSTLENVRIVAQTNERGSFSFDLFRDGRSVAEEKAYDILDRVGLGSKADEQAVNLSHGNQRRLSIAMALATEPSVLLLDEPTSGMGPTETEETAAMIESIQSEFGLTLLLIEHDMSIVLSMSDRITVLDRGRILATGTPDEIQNSDEVQKAYLGGMREEL
ncbi:ABC transporter ATP-binding protein [Halostella litorea]|uniref:ABC transporter ATP-binding protein n=1 Tax=Halostella litorea TaxID=2528831 RepID=UPI00109217E1|nr:ABC transporter ATP-binding protein [Halostella litorea]